MDMSSALPRSLSPLTAAACGHSSDTTQPNEDRTVTETSTATLVVSDILPLRPPRRRRRPTMGRRRSIAHSDAR